MNNQRGNVSVFVLAAIVVATGLALAVAHLGTAVGEKARAETAADAAALAAAGVLARNGDALAARVGAEQTAAANGARLLECHCAETEAIVTVALGDARAIARAVVDGQSASISRSARIAKSDLTLCSDMCHGSLA